MHVKTFFIAALAATVAAERVPYQLSRKSVSLVALAARQEPGYKPEKAFCGAGDSCKEACGAGYEQCPSTDNLSHCYDKAKGETCCQDANGNACEAGYYCAVDSKEGTWCCPDGMSAEECASKYHVTDGLSSQVPSSTSTISKPDPTTTSDAVHTTSTDDKTTVTDSPTTVKDSATTDPAPIVTSTFVPGGNSTIPVTVGTPTTTETGVPIVTDSGAGSLVVPGALAAALALAAPLL